MLLIRSLNARHERRRRGLHTRREGPDDLVERVCLAQNRGAVARARRNHNAPARTVARGVDAVAGRPSEGDAALRVLGENHDATLKSRWIYAKALYRNDSATLDDLREAVTTIEDTERIARRVFGGAHPLTEGAAGELQKARAALRAREERGA